MDFEDFEDSAEQELKRADHLLYVTLKYTRNVDVIKNIIKRLINAYDYAALEALKYLKVKKIPDAPRLRIKLLGEKIPQFSKEVKFYLMMKELDAAPFKRREEFRKNVTLLTSVMDVNIEKVKSFFERTILFVKTVETMVVKKKK